MASEGKNRIAYLVTSFVLLLFLGLIYAWSVFIGPLEGEFGWARSQTSVTFTISMIGFCVGNLASGAITPRTSPRVSILIAAACAAAGFAASSFTTSLLWIYVSYGVFCGFAVGLGANCALSTALKWFPDRQGLASGALLMGFGLGSLAFSTPVTMLLSSLGWRTTFRVLAVVFGALLVLAALVLRNPSAEWSAAMVAKARQGGKVARHDFTTPEMLKSPAFWVFMLWIIFVTSVGLALISNAVPAAEAVLMAQPGADAAAATLMATTAMGTISGFNGLGRLSAGFFWDRFGFRATLVFVSGGMVLSMAACLLADMSLSFPLIVVGFVLLGLAYGGSMSSCSAMIGSFFGTKHYSLNYGIASCNLIVASLIGPTILSALLDSSGGYFSSFAVFLGFAAVSFVLLFFVRRPKDPVRPEGGEEVQ